MTINKGGNEQLVSQAGYVQYEVVDNRTKQWFWDFSAVFSSDLSPQAKLVRLCLASYADRDTRTANPSLSRLARETGLGRSTVAKALKELEVKGWISRRLRSRSDAGFDTTLYLLLDPPAAQARKQGQEDSGGNQGSPSHGLPSPSDGLGSLSGGLGSLSGGLPSPHHGLGVIQENQGLQGGLSTRETRVVHEVDYLVHEVDTNKNNNMCVVVCNNNGRERQMAEAGNGPGQESASSEQDVSSRTEIEVGALALTLSAQLSLNDGEALKVANALLARYPVRTILAKLPLAAVREGRIRNVVGFLAQAIEEDWQLPVALDRRKPERTERTSDQGDIRGWKDTKYADLYLS